MAATLNGKHRDEPTTAAERYGRHSEANAAVHVFAVLQKVIERGEAIRLAWREDDSSRPVEASQEFPTAVLPVIYEPQSPDFPVDHDTDADDTEHKPVAREARQWAWSGDFSWWLNALAG